MENKQLEILKLIARHPRLDMLITSYLRGGCLPPIVDDETDDGEP